MPRRTASAERLQFQPGDFLPGAAAGVDAFTMGRVLHDWGQQRRCAGVRGVARSIPAALLSSTTYDDDDRSKNAFGLLMSLNMLIETPGGFDYTARIASGG